MIKINLLRSRVSRATEGDDVEGLSFEASEDAQAVSEKNKVIAKKVFLMSLAVIGLIVWETYLEGVYKDESRALQAQMNKTKLRLTKLKKESGRAELVEDEAKKIEEKLKIIVELSGKRLKELKALDFLQSIIPDGAWLANIDYDGDKILFKGFAQSDDDLSKFVSRLEDSVFFDEVLLVKSVKSSSKAGTVKSFELSSVLGEVR